jgi:hypothetical protein
MHRRRDARRRRRGMPRDSVVAPLESLVETCVSALIVPRMGAGRGRRASEGDDG